MFYNKNKYLVFLLFVWAFSLQAQNDLSFERDSSDVITPINDSLFSVKDSFIDSIPVSADPLDKVKLADDIFDSPFKYRSENFNRLNNPSRSLLLVEGARIEYDEFTLEGDTIIVNTKDKTAHVFSKPNSYVEFSGAGQNLKAKSLKYNFETKKGIIVGAITQQSDLFIVADLTRLEGDAIEADSGKMLSVGYSKDAIISTCNHPEPHYGLHAYKQKIIQDRIIVTGPANLEVAGVPTPLFLPFAFLPLDLDVRTGGLILPREYDVQPDYGFGLRNIGYFQSFSDHWTAILYADIYTRGSHGLRLQSNYNYKYRFSGNVELAYSNRQREILGFLEKEKNLSYAVRWTHNQDQKAHPYSSFSASVNVQTNNHDRYTYNGASVVFNNQFSSNINYNYNFPERPFRLTLNASHTQNSNTGRMEFNLPNASFYLNRIRPFERKEKIGKERWYEKITFMYNADFSNKVAIEDSLLFTSQFLENMRMGLRQRATSDMNLKVFKYLNFTPNISYNETWYFDTVYKTFDPTTIYSYDTIRNELGEITTIEQNVLSYGTVNTERNAGFATFRDMNFGVSMNTNLFGMLRFRRGPVKAVRHVLKPNFSYRYQPVFKFDHERDVRYDSRLDTTRRYSIFEDGIFGRPQMGATQETFNYSFINLIEMKLRSKKDTIDRKITLLESINVNGNYNFRADSLKWSQIGISGSTRFFKNLTTLYVNVTFDPYIRDERGRRINTTAWEHDRKLLRFDQANFRLSTNFSIRQVRDFIKDIGSSDTDVAEARPIDALPEFLSMFDEFRIGHNINFGWANMTERDTFSITTNNISTSGRIKLSDKWNLRVGNIGYEFTRNQFTFPDFGIARDLHCWEMGVDWQPYYGTFSFFIRVKPSSFDFLNIPYRKSSSDVLQGF